MNRAEIKRTMDQVSKNKYLNIYFHHRIFGGENNLNLFSLPFIGERK